MMKRILTLAFVAFMMGAFAVNADAQGSKSVKETDWNMVIKDYQTKVDQCVSLYSDLQDKSKDTKSLSTEFSTLLTKTEEVGTNIEKHKSELTRSQVNLYNIAKKKLSVVYQKGN